MSPRHALPFFIAVLALGPFAACGGDDRAPYVGFEPEPGPGTPSTAAAGQGSPENTGAPPGGGGAPTDESNADNDGGLGAGGAANNAAPDGPTEAPPTAGELPRFFENVGEADGNQIPGFYGAGSDIGLRDRPGP
jgi:hypothetical protein